MARECGGARLTMTGCGAPELRTEKGLDEGVAGVDVMGAAVGGGEIEDFTEAHEDSSAGISSR